MAKKYRSYTRNKMIIASNMSSEIPKSYKFSDFTEASNFLKVSTYRLRRIAMGELDEDYIRAEDGTLYHIALEYNYVVHARPEKLDYEEIDFTSAYKCITFFGISSDTYYRRATESMLYEENPKPVKDKEGYKWYLTFLEPVKDKFIYNKKKAEVGK